MPPGAAASWNVVDNDEDQTTSKSTNVIVVTSPVYVPMTNDAPASADVTPVWADTERTKSSSQDAVTSRHVIDPTLPSDAVAVHGKHERAAEDAALLLGLPRGYIAIISVLGILGLAVIIIVTVVTLHMCCKVRKSKKAEILEEVVKAHMYGDLNKVVYSEPPTIKVNEKL